MRSLASRTLALSALAALLFASGCGGDNSTLTPESSDSGFNEGQQLERQGRPQEALAAYLKVIARRGDQAPESNLDVGLLYLENFKDPIMAIYYFRKYVELKPNSESAGRVRGLIETAKRDFARTLAIQPPDNQVGQADTLVQVERLQRENDDLKAELAALRGGIAIAPAPRQPAGSEPGLGLAPPPPDVPVIAETPSPASSAAVATAPAAAPSRAARTHTVVRGETLYSLAARYYGKGSRWPEIVAANKDQLGGGDPKVKPGMVLKIP